MNVLCNFQQNALLTLKVSVETKLINNSLLHGHLFIFKIWFVLLEMVIRKTSCSSAK